MYNMYVYSNVHVHVVPCITCMCIVYSDYNVHVFYIVHVVPATSE